MAKTYWDRLREHNLNWRYRFSVGSLITGSSVLALVVLASLAYIYSFLGLGLHAALVTSLALSPFVSIAVILGIMALFAVVLALRNLIQINLWMNKPGEGVFNSSVSGKLPTVASAVVLAATPAVQANVFNLAAAAGGSVITEISDVIEQDKLKQERFLEIVSAGTEDEAIAFLRDRSNFAFRPTKADERGYTALFLAKLRGFTDLELRLSNYPYLSAFVYWEMLSGKMCPVASRPWSRDEGLKVIEGIIERNDFRAFEVVLETVDTDGWPSAGILKAHGMVVDSFLAKMGRLKMFEILAKRADFYPDSGSQYARKNSTPLIEASRAGHTDLVKFLLEHKADSHFNNSVGETATSVAANGEIRGLLEVHEASLESSSGATLAP